jgi:hypothetical protein
MGSGANIDKNRARAEVRDRIRDRKRGEPNSPLDFREKIRGGGTMRIQMGVLCFSHPPRRIQVIKLFFIHGYTLYFF